MLIECQIKFTKDGLTIIQQFDEDNAATVPSFVQSDQLLATYAETMAAKAAAQASGSAGSGGSTSNSPGGGGSTSNSPGGGGSTSNSPGGGGAAGSPGSAPITIIGPIFFGGPNLCCCEDKKKEKD